MNRINRIIGLHRSAFALAFGLARWHINRYIFNKALPLIATFQLTNRCNFNCCMCNIRNNPKQDTMPLESFKKIIGDLSDMGCVYVTLSGGEPLLIKDILDYVSFAKSKIPIVNLVTNGFLLTEKFSKDIGQIGLDSISISIDALGDRHDSIRGASGAFDRAISGLKTIKKLAPGVKVIVNTVISQHNLADIAGLADLTEALGAWHKFQPVYKHPVFDGQSASYVDAAVKNIDINQLKSVIKYLKEKRNVSNSSYFLSCIPDYFLSDYRKEIFNEDCFYPAFSCEFREDVKMYPCIVGKSWQGGYDAKSGIKKSFFSRQYRLDIENLKKCRLCRENFSVCYIEPRLTLPLDNFIKYIFRK